MTTDDLRLAEAEARRMFRCRCPPGIRHISEAAEAIVLARDGSSVEAICSAIGSDDEALRGTVRRIVEHVRTSDERG